MDKIVAVVGPTGSGKSDLAVRLAEELNGEVISCDSMQVYREMNIGTAKITEEEMRGIPHHLIDVQDYSQPYNVQIFQQRCRQAIADILSRGKLPVLCGGTGLYLKAALYDYEFEQEEPDEDYRKFLDGKSTEELYNLLQQQDPGSLDKIHPNNRKRILRALMIAHTGRTKSQRENEQTHLPIYDIFYTGIEPERSVLLERMNARVDRMFEAGLPQEVKKLFADPKTRSYTSFYGIGYKEFAGWLDGKEDLDSVKEAIKIHTRQYSKRQMTWFKNQMPVRWYAPGSQEKILEDCRKWLNNDSAECSAENSAADISKRN